LLYLCFHNIIFTIRFYKALIAKPDNTIFFRKPEISLFTTPFAFLGSFIFDLNQMIVPKNAFIYIDPNPVRIS